MATKAFLPSLRCILLLLFIAVPAYYINEIIAYSMATNTSIGSSSAMIKSADSNSKILHEIYGIQLKIQELDDRVTSIEMKDGHDHRKKHRNKVMSVY